MWEGTLKVYKERIQGTNAWAVMVLNGISIVQEHLYFVSTAFDVENGPEEMHWLFDELKARYES
jgi:hypothetical protein